MIMFNGIFSRLVISSMADQNGNSIRILVRRPDTVTFRVWAAIISKLIGPRPFRRNLSCEGEVDPSFCRKSSPVRNMPDQDFLAAGQF
jgi:hypothetical protein